MSRSSRSGRAAQLAAALALIVPAAGIAAEGRSTPAGAAAVPAAQADPLAGKPAGARDGRSDRAAAAAGTRPDPADPAAAVAPARHASPLAGYAPMREDRTGWREANEAVEAAGGHIGIMREEMRRQQGAKPPAAPKEGR